MYGNQSMMMSYMTMRGGIKGDQAAYELLKNLTLFYPIDVIADYLDMSPKIIELIIECFGDNIKVIYTSQIFDLSDWEKYFLIVSILILLVASLLGNLFILITLHPFRELFLKWRKSQHHESRSSNDIVVKVTDVFFWNSALLDLFWSLVVSPSLTLQLINNGYWVFDEIMCKIYGFLTYFLLSINSLSLVAISVDRYFSIVINDKTKRTTSTGMILNILMTCFMCSKKRNGTSYASFKTYIWLCIIVVGSFLISLPFLIHTDIYYIVEGDSCLWVTENKQCLNLWPGNHNFESIFKIIFIILIYQLPGIVVFFCYVSISCRLFAKKATTLDSSTTSQAAVSRIKEKRRIAKLLIVDSLFYVICWFPFSLWILYSCLNDLYHFSDLTLRQSIHVFFYLYMGPVANVSLKWIFRAIGSWPRIRLWFKSLQTSYYLSRARVSSSADSKQTDKPTSRR